MLKVTLSMGYLGKGSRRPGLRSLKNFKLSCPFTAPNEVMLRFLIKSCLAYKSPLHSRAVYAL